MFRAACAELGRLLIYEAVREFLPTVEAEIASPMGPVEISIVDPTRPIKVVPILRAGLVLLEQAQQVTRQQIFCHAPMNGMHGGSGPHLCEAAVPSCAFVLICCLAG